MLVAHARPSSIVTDAVTIISIVTCSNSLLTLAVASHAVAVGKVWVPPGPENTEMARNVVLHVSNQQWRQRVQKGLRDPQVQSLARLFVHACMDGVPTQAENPILDEMWITDVSAYLESEPALQMAAQVLLMQFSLPDNSDIATSSGNLTMNPQPVATALEGSPARASVRPRNGSRKNQSSRKRRKK